MPFVTRTEKREPPESPEALFRELRPTDRSVRDLLLRQGDALRAYHKLDSHRTDVAIELPTGAGKTLVGLLVAEWRRLAFDQRTAYLCPTVQLANQAAAKASEYGLDVVNLTGSHRDWDQAELTKYRRHKAIAIASYRAVFNSAPKLDSPQTLILDDAHAAEGPIASTWSISAKREEISPLYADLLATVIGFLPSRIAEPLRDDSLDPHRRWKVELIPPSIVAERIAQIDEALKAHIEDGDENFFTCRAIGNSLDRCLMYVSWNEILLRPLIPPTLAHSAFRDAEQRVYMSATLGSAGELERAFGVPRIDRVQLGSPDEGGFGRRFFVLPNASHPPAVADGIVRAAIDTAGRVAIVTPSFAEAEEVTEACLPEEMEVLTADDVEDGLEPFVNEKRAALLLANRYDGIDLPGDDCRLVVLSGLPANTHLQERFLLNTLGARRILDERIRTRLVQGSGRATRSSRDFAAVLIRGNGLTDFCSRDDEIFAMPPQLQAELQFGLENSANPDKDPMQLLAEFWEQGDEWGKADAYLKAETNKQHQHEPDGSTALGAAAKAEVLCWQALWRGDLKRALLNAHEVTDALGGSEELRPYRALWFYLGASWAHQLASTGDRTAASTAATLMREAEGCARSMSWAPLPLQTAHETGSIAPDERARKSAAYMLKLRGTRFDAHVGEVEANLNNDGSKQFEEGLRGLGELLGFEAVRPDGQGQPDGVWRHRDELWLVFEAKSEEKDSAPLSVSTVRQASTHRKWISETYDWLEPAESLTVIVSPRETIDPEAAKIAGAEALVTPTTMRRIGGRCIQSLREIHAQAKGQAEGHLAKAIAERFSAEKLDTDSLVAELGRHLVRDDTAE